MWPLPTRSLIRNVDPVWVPDTYMQVTRSAVHHVIKSAASSWIFILDLCLANCVSARLPFLNFIDAHGRVLRSLSGGQIFQHACDWCLKVHVEMMHVQQP